MAGRSGSTRDLADLRTATNTGNLSGFGLGLVLANGAIGAVAGVTTKIAPLAWIGVAVGVAYGIAPGAGMA